MSDYNKVKQMLDDLNLEDDSLLFPLNVHESITGKGGMKKSEKNGIFLSFWAVISFVIAWVAAGYLRQIVPDYYLLITIVLEIVLQLTAGTFVLRIVADEDTLKSEMSNKDKSFAKYYSIYKEHVAGDTSPYDFDVIELSDGTYVAAIQCLLGYNTDTRSRSTYEAVQAVNILMNKRGYSNRVYHTTEVFSESDEARAMLRDLEKIQIPSLFKAQRDIVLKALQIAEDQSNVVCVTRLIYAKTRAQKEDFGRLIHDIVSILTANETVYRSVKILDYQKTLEFTRIYNKISILDMGLVRTVVAAAVGISCKIKLLKVYGESGKVYVTKDLSNMSNEIINEQGIAPVKK